MKKAPKPAPFRPKLDDKLAAMPGIAPTDAPDYVAGLPSLDPALVAAVSGEARRDAARARPRQDVRGSASSLPGSDRGAETELLGAMASRLRTLEGQVTALQEDLLSREAELRRLKRGRSTQDAVEDTAILEAHNVKLMQQLLDMKRWLKQNRIPYEGMVPSWAGSLEEGDEHGEAVPEADLVLLSAPTSANGPRRPSGAAPAQPTRASLEGGGKGVAALGGGDGGFNWQTTFDAPVGPAPAERTGVPDMRRILHNVRELNLVAGDRTEVSAQGGGNGGGAPVHKLRERKPVAIVMYRDGLCINGGPFRPYHWPSGQAVVQDLLDGYFPYEFKQAHPEGMPIEVVDRTGEDCPRDAKEGRIQTLQSAHENDRGYHVIDKASFLNRLPKSVVKNGQLVEVRSEIDAMMGGGKAQAPVVVKTQALEAKRGDGAEQRVTTIQVKCPTSVGGSELVVWVVHLFYEQTVGELRRAVEAQVRERDALRGHTFQLCTTFPQRIFADDTATLQQTDLVPTATVFLRFLPTAAGGGPAPSERCRDSR